MVVILEITVKRMTSINECEKLRGVAEVKLLKEIQKLRKACEVKAPNKRMVAKLVARLDKALENLINSHAYLMMEMKVRMHEHRFTQYMDPLEDAAKEVKAMAEVLQEPWSNVRRRCPHSMLTR